MDKKTVVTALAELVRSDNILVNEPMKNHTTFRIGGQAACYVKIESAEQLAAVWKCLQEMGAQMVGKAQTSNVVLSQESSRGAVLLPVLVLGNGSNVLVSDEGFPGVVLEICEKMNAVHVEGTKLIAEAGALMSKVARIAYENGLTGFEFAAGIPGTIGGGVVMNAGAYGGELKQVITSVKVMNDQGEIFEIENEQMEFGYRTSLIKKQPLIVVGVTLQLKKGEKEEIRALMEELAFRRRDKQPLEYPSAGSTFKRPEGYFAGELIMKAGLRGCRIGGAQVSEKHCGFVINTGDGTAQDVLQLMEHVQKTVLETFGVRLEPEVIVIKGNGTE